MPAYTYIPSLMNHGKVPDQSILSSTIYSDERVKIVLFRFAAGQELSAHTASMPATLTFLSGGASVRLGDDQQEATAGTFVHMPAKLEHGIQARTETVMLLTMLKNPT